MLGVASCEGIMELKINYGPGYRVYYIQRGKTVINTPCGRRQKHAKKRHRSSKKAGNRSL